MKKLIEDSDGYTYTKEGIEIRDEISWLIDDFISEKMLTEDIGGRDLRYIFFNVVNLAIAKYHVHQKIKEG